MVLVLFRSRVRSGVERDLEAVGARMAELAAAMPGFISYREYSSADGESLALIEFESHETLAAWREHPEHKKAQAAGRERFFAEYQITICQPVRESRFKA